MNETDMERWRNFRLTDGQTLSQKEFVLICELHALYFNHSYYKPCTCSPKTVVRWIKNLNDLYGTYDNKAN
jgi:hypothetical protein|tara:strand:- start:448 stop:660 length:213 start_codon:yes stop_codon:yes gene_type:complete